MSPPKKLTSALEGKLKIEYIPIGKVVPYNKNPRHHPPEKLDKLEAIVARWGMLPMLIDEEEGILGGHANLQVARRLKLRTVPVIRVTGLPAHEKKAYIIALNKIAEDSGWNQALLTGEMLELKSTGMDLSLTGFSAQAIEYMLSPPPAPITDPAIPEARLPAVSRLGDIWDMGGHRLLCGSNANAKYMDALMAGRQASMVFTDPPYGVSYEARSGKFEMIKGDDLRRGQLAKMLHGAFATAMPHVQENAGWYIWHASSTAEDFRIAMRDVGLVENGCIIWVKPGMVLGWSDYRWAHEPCFYAARQGVRAAFHGGREDTTVWRVDVAKDKDGGQLTSVSTGIVIATEDGREVYVAAGAPKGRKIRHVHLREGEHALLQGSQDDDTVWEVSRDAGHGKDESLHPNQKPVELARKAIRNSSLEGEIVLDMFSGSASTLIAAAQLKRVAYVADLDPVYADVGVRRWQDLTGEKAVHAKEGKTFDEIAKARAKARPAKKAA